jgi:hypothetical protein
LNKNYLLLLAAIGLSFTLRAQELIPFSTGTAYHYLWGYKDANGKVVVEPKYSQCPYLYEGYAVVELNGKRGYVDKTGKEITPIKYDNASSTQTDGRFKVSAGGKYGFIDTTGKEVIPLIYSNANYFNSGRALVTLNEKPIFIDKTGKTIISLDAYQETHEQFAEGMCGVKTAAGWGFIDVAGKVVIPLKYDRAEPMSESFSAVVIGGKPDTYGQMEGGKWGFIDKTGKDLILFKYQFLGSFTNGIAIVNTGGKLNTYGAAFGGKWGFMDKTGKEISPLKYDYAGGFHDGLCVVNIGGTWASDGMGGNEIKGGKWGFVDLKANEAIPPQFDSASMFLLGEATVTKGGETFEINNKGERITPAPAEYVPGGEESEDYEDY